MSESSYWICILKYTSLLSLRKKKKKGPYTGAFQEYFIKYL